MAKNTRNKCEPKYTKWLKEVEGSNFWRAWGFSVRPMTWIYGGLIATALTVLGVLHRGYWFAIACGVASALTGLGFLLNASWCLRKSWELSERAKLDDGANKEEIETAVSVCRDHVGVSRNWAAAWFSIAGAILALTGLLLKP